MSVIFTTLIAIVILFTAALVLMVPRITSNPDTILIWMVAYVAVVVPAGLAMIAISREIDTNK